MKNLCKQNWYQITLLFLFCVTVFLRFYKLTVLPDVLHIDEAALGYNSWCLANYGTDRYLNVLPFYPQNFYGGQSPLYTYLVVLLIKFFGKGNLSVFLVRFPAAFASLLLWITGTRSMSLIFDNKKITLAAALFLCFCPYFVMSGRLCPGLQYNVVLHFLFCSCTAFVSENRKTAYFTSVRSLLRYQLVLLCIELSDHTYFSGSDLSLHALP